MSTDNVLLVTVSTVGALIGALIGVLIGTWVGRRGKRGADATHAGGPD